MMMGAASPLYPQQNPSSSSRKTSTKITPSGSSANLQQGAQIKTAQQQQQQLHLRAANNTTTTTNINNNFTKDRKRLNSNAATTTATITATAYQPLSSSPAAATINMNNNKTNTNNNATAAAMNIKTESAADDRELKRQRRKQSNRESARRSRLRKQAETEELGNILERYATENMKLRSAVERLASEREIRLENERVLAKCIEEGVNHMFTVSAIQMHPKAIVVCDEDATLELRVRTAKYFKSLPHREEMLGVSVVPTPQKGGMASGDGSKPKRQKK